MMNGARLSFADEAASANYQWLTEKCSDCHSGSSSSGGFDLANLTLDLDDPRVAQQWARIHDRVQAGEMPPEDAEPISETERDQFLTRTSQWITSSQREVYERLGRVKGRRLTNLQLERTLHDLLGIDLPLVSEMAAEPATGEFTTLADNASSIAMSTILRCCSSWKRDIAWFAGWWRFPARQSPRIRPR
jgi:hypothetical protein